MPRRGPTADRGWLAGVARWPRWLHGLTALLVTAGLGALDWLTGYEYAASAFYLLPVAQGAWFLGRRWGLAISVLAAVVWQVSNALAGEVMSSPLVYAWNAGTRVAIFAVTTALLGSLQDRLRFEMDLSRTDPTTGALNSRGFRERLEAAVAESRRKGRELTLLYLDADGFKTVNDTLGHSAGDAVLRAAATALQGSLRAEDAVGRLGGDEFAVVLADTGSSGGQAAAAKVLERLGAAMARGGWRVTFSVGCATFASAPASVDQALQTADALMYSAKATGPGLVHAATAAGDRALPGS